MDEKYESVVIRMNENWRWMRVTSQRISGSCGMMMYGSLEWHIDVELDYDGFQS